MKFADIRSALIQSWLDGDFGLDTAYPNKKFDPTAGTPWAAVFILPNQPEVATLGERGEDVHDGVFQISLFYPPDQGDADIMAKADAVAAHYKAGNRYTYDSQGVLIRSCGRSQGRLDDGWYRVDLTVNWQSYVSRAPTGGGGASPSANLTGDVVTDLVGEPFETINDDSASTESTEVRVVSTPFFEVPSETRELETEVISAINESIIYVFEFDQSGGAVGFVTSTNLFSDGDHVNITIDSSGVCEFFVNGGSETSGTISDTGNQMAILYQNGDEATSTFGPMEIQTYAALEDQQFNQSGNGW